MLSLLSRRAHSAVIGALLLAAGCEHGQQFKRIALTNADRAQVHSPRTVVVMSSRMLGFSYPAGVSTTKTPYTPASLDVPSSGDLLMDVLVGVIGGALVGAVQTSVAEQVRTSKIKEVDAKGWPVRDALLGFDPAPSLATSLAEELASLHWMKGNAVEVHQIAEAPTVEGATRLMRRHGAETVLVIGADYTLSPNADALLLRTEVSLLSDAVESTSPSVSQGDRWSVRPKTAYYNVFFIAERLPEESGQSWSDAGRAQATIDAGFREMARMIAFDLQQDPVPHGPGVLPAFDARLVTIHWRAVNTEQGFAVDWSPTTLPPLEGMSTDEHTETAYIVREENGRRWARLLLSGGLVAMGTPYYRDP